MERDHEKHRTKLAGRVVCSKKRPLAETGTPAASTGCAMNEVFSRHPCTALRTLAEFEALNWGHISSGRYLRLLFEVRVHTRMPLDLLIRLLKATLLSAAHIRSQFCCVSQIAVHDFAWLFVCIHMQQNSNAKRHGMRNGDLQGTEQRHGIHADVSSCFSRKAADQVMSCREDSRDHFVVICDLVAIQNVLHQFSSRLANLVWIVLRYRDGPSDPTYRHHEFPYQVSRKCSR